jgi:23S rRNA (pseudouridine1915-N3)-methyltransferase
MKIRIIASGKMKRSPLLDLCEDYVKRMHWSVTLKEIDGPITVRHLPDPAFIVAMDERGETLSSPDLTKKIAKWRDAAPGNEVVFVIGGADGLGDQIRKKAKFLLSFGKQTWPHMLVRVMLLEQIYRAQQITAGHPYHRQ